MDNHKPPGQTLWITPVDNFDTGTKPGTKEKHVGDQTGDQRGPSRKTPGHRPGPSRGPTGTKPAGTGTKPPPYKGGLVPPPPRHHPHHHPTNRTTTTTTPTHYDGHNPQPNGERATMSRNHQGHGQHRRTRATWLATTNRICQLQLPGCRHHADTIDDITPLAHGGTDTPNNWRPACRPCNSRRGTQTDQHLNTPPTPTGILATTTPPNPTREGGPVSGLLFEEPFHPPSLPFPFLTSLKPSSPASGDRR